MSPKHPHSVVEKNTPMLVVPPEAYTVDTCVLVKDGVAFLYIKPPPRDGQEEHTCAKALLREDDLVARFPVRPPLRPPIFEPP